MTGSTSIHLSSASSHQDEGATAWFEHSTATRINTEALMAEALRREYPNLHLTATRRINLLNYAADGHAAVAPIDKEKDRLSSLSWSLPLRRRDGVVDQKDGLIESVKFGKFLYEWKGKEFVLYVVDCRDGSEPISFTVEYLLSSSVQATQDLLLAAGRWSTDLHNEVWVFDQGYWQKSKELWQSVQSAEWENVILDEDMKKSLIRDVDTFFDSRATYEKLKVPWKRGVIYYGPPGNGKTISIKAMMHSLYKRKDPIPTLYVKSLQSFSGPESSIKAIFGQARRYAPCYLIFEDLDSLIIPSVRSYFLNEVDGLKSNDGILMVGSTNHIDQLDPGIAKRPSRFDRKYFFPNPNEKERFQYAKFWQGKLADNKEIEFPDEICQAVAEITDGFSFAYMQEAFIAALLALAREEDGEGSVGETGRCDYFSVMDDLDKLPLWIELKKQVKNLRTEMERDSEEARSTSVSASVASKEETSSAYDEAVLKPEKNEVLKSYLKGELDRLTHEATINRKENSSLRNKAANLEQNFLEALQENEKLKEEVARVRPWLDERTNFLEILNHEVEAGATLKDQVETLIAENKQLKEENEVFHRIRGNFMAKFLGDAMVEEARQRKNNPEQEGPTLAAMVEEAIQNSRAIQAQLSVAGSGNGENAERENNADVDAPAPDDAQEPQEPEDDEILTRKEVATRRYRARQAAKRAAAGQSEFQSADGDAAEGS